MSDVKGAAKDVRKASGRLVREMTKWTAKKTAATAIAAAIGITGISLANFTIAQLDGLIKMGAKAGYYYAVNSGKVIIKTQNATKTQNAQKLKANWKAYLEKLPINAKKHVKHPYGKGLVGIAGLAALKTRKKWINRRK